MGVLVSSHITSLKIKDRPSLQMPFYTNRHIVEISLNILKLRYKYLQAHRFLVSQQSLRRKNETKKNKDKHRLRNFSI